MPTHPRSAQYVRTREKANRAMQLTLVNMKVEEYAGKRPSNMEYAEAHILTARNFLEKGWKMEAYIELDSAQRLISKEIVKEEMQQASTA